MNDPRRAIQNAIWTRLNSVGITAYVNPPDGTALPCTVFGGGTVTPGPLTTKNSEGGDVTHTLVSWAEDPTTAQQNAETAIAALTDRNNHLDITGYVTVRWDLDYAEDTIVDDNDPSEHYYGVPYRIRVVVKQA